MYKFYKELTEESCIDHKIDKWSISDPYTYRQWYYEDIKNKDTLLITVGDSWTWGDHLGTIDWDKATDDPIRLTQIFGRKLSESLNADWVNIASPGCSNYWMLEQLYNIESHLLRVKNQYKNIHLIITLTEDLRESTYTKIIDVNTPYQQLWNKSKNIQDFLITVEKYLFQNLQLFFERISFVNCLVSRAFTDTWTDNKKYTWLVDKTWCDVIQDNVNYNNYQKPVPFIGQMSITPLTEKFILQDLARKSEFLQIMKIVETRWGFLASSLYNLNGSTCHPNPLGHVLWAEYFCIIINKLGKH